MNATTDATHKTEPGVFEAVRSSVDSWRLMEAFIGLLCVALFSALVAAVWTGVTSSRETTSALAVAARAVAEVDADAYSLELQDTVSGGQLAIWQSMAGSCIAPFDGSELTAAPTCTATD